MSTYMQFACLPKWRDNCVCKPGSKTDCGVIVPKPRADRKGGKR